MNALIGHNNPPPDIDAINATYEPIRMEAENWLDGQPVENEAQMRAVDELLAGVKAWEKDLKDGQQAEAKPHHDAHKAALARWKPTLDDAARFRGGLVALVDAYKRKLAEEKAAERRRAYEEAEAARRAAEVVAAAANPASIDDVRAAAEARREAEEAQARAAAAAKDTVKGLRTYEVTEVIDVTAWARVAWVQHRAECETFFADLARRHRPNIPGVAETRKEKRAV